MIGINDTHLVSIIKKNISYFTIIKAWTKTVLENAQQKGEMNKENH